MKLMYISKEFSDKRGSSVLSHMHYKSIEKIIGKNSIYTIALDKETTEEKENFKSYKRYKNKFERLKRNFEGNTQYISNYIINDICKLIENEKIDVIFIDDSIFGKLIYLIKKKFKDVYIISFYHDVKKNLYFQWLKKIGIKFTLEYLTGIRNEFLSQKYSDVNITLNKRESKMLEKFYNRQTDFELPIYVSEPNNNNNNILAEMNIDNKYILFVGALYYPNVEGIKWFCENVMKKIDSKYKLLIVGKDMELIKDELIYDNVSIVGTVNDLSIYYSSADIVIAPIFDGGGMKVKTAEAFSYGKVFIGTDESLEGYYENIPNDILGRFIFKCSNADEFIKVLNKLKDEKTNKVEGDVKDIFYKYYSEEAAIKTLKEILNI